MMKRRFVLLDRDGTIIVERNYLADPDGVELLPGAARGLREIQHLGLGLAVITNQSAIGRGFIDETRLEQIHERVRRLLEQEKVFLDGIFFCPHLPEDDCDCRKPGTALLSIAEKELGFDARDCFVIGDKDCDIAMGQRAGATTFLVRTGYGEKTEMDTMNQPDFVVDNLEKAAEMIKDLLLTRKKGEK
jgi:D-glycero-D-manno-heptose 1,7-bisphosphate phosphatase